MEYERFLKLNWGERIDAEAVIVRDNISSIAPKAFSNCNKLKSIFRYVTNLGALSFQNCSALTSIVIPNAAIDIGDSCVNLASVKTYRMG